MTDTDAAPQAGQHCVADELAAEPDSVTRIRQEIVGFARGNCVREEDLERIALAVTEAAANAVVHAYLPGERGELRYAADIGDGELHVVISDDGLGIRADQQSAGLGLGLRIIAQSTSDFAVTARDPHGIDVWMRFVLRGPAVTTG